jgi:anti-sigma factor RsiW
MTECDKIQEILPAYLEGLASPPQSEMVSSHLATCQTCGFVVKALMKSQKLIANLEEVEPPQWLRTRVMARLEEGVEQEENQKWSFERLRDLLLYPLKVKIPIQAFTVLLVAVVVVYVYRTIQPEVKLAQQAPQAVATAPVENGDSALKSQAKRRAEEPMVRSDQPESPTKTGIEDVAKPAPGIDGLLGGASQQPSSPPMLKITESMKDEMRRAVAEPEPKKTKAAKVFIPAAPGISEPGEQRAGAEAKTEAAKGTAAPVTRPETLAVTVQASNSVAGAKEVEAILRALNAPIVTESREGSSIISTEVPLQKAREIIRRLNAVGQIQQRGQLSETAPDKAVAVRILVLQKHP